MNHGDFDDLCSEPYRSQRKRDSMSNIHDFPSKIEPQLTELARQLSDRPFIKRIDFDPILPGDYMPMPNTLPKVVATIEFDPELNRSTVHVTAGPNREFTGTPDAARFEATQARGQAETLNKYAELLEKMANVAQPQQS